MLYPDSSDRSRHGPAPLVLAALVIGGGLVAVFLAIFGTNETESERRTASGKRVPARPAPTGQTLPRDPQPSTADATALAEILGRAKLKIATNDLDAAGTLIREALAKNPRHWETHMLLGVVAAKKDDHEAALRHYAQAGEANPRAPELEHSRGLSLLALGRLEEAHARFSRVLDWNPGFADAYLKRGLIEAQRDQFHKAAEDFTAFIELQPQNPLGYQNRAAAHARLGEQTKSNRDLMKARELRALEKER